MARTTMLIDLDRCTGCYACEIACKMENDVPLGNYLTKMDQVGPMGTFPDIKMYWMPTGMCQHCANPACVEVCPTGASSQREDGVVLVDAESCIGCQLCMSACPYGARSLNAKTNVVQKCTSCAPLRDEGGKPACVKCCTASARYFGDIDDPESEIAQAIAAGEGAVYTLADEGTEPTMRYILHEKTGPWQG